MIDLTDDERRQVLGEVLADQLQAIFEYVKDIPGMKQDIRSINSRLTGVENKLTVIEHVVRAHETDIKELKAALI